MYNDYNYCTHCTWKFSLCSLQGFNLREEESILLQDTTAELAAIPDKTTTILLDWYQKQNINYDVATDDDTTCTCTCTSTYYTTHISEEITEIFLRRRRMILFWPERAGRKQSDGKFNTVFKKSDWKVSAAFKKITEKIVPVDGEILDQY